MPVHEAGVPEVAEADSPSDQRLPFNVGAVEPVRSGAARARPTAVKHKKKKERKEKKHQWEDQSGWTYSPQRYAEAPCTAAAGSNAVFMNSPVEIRGV